MKFGLESEKFLFDLKSGRPSDGVFRFIDALSDLDFDCHITNEFVLNMVEIVTDPSDSPMHIIQDYIQNYLMFNSIAARENVAMVGLGSLPMDYQPHMSPKWPYQVQNSILDNKLHSAWTMNKESPLTPAGNCAGIHVHAEVETLPEYLFSNRELQDKFNLALMLTPMSAFSSSAYFFGEHTAMNMRGTRYFNGVYRDFPLNGGLPPVMESSEKVLKFFKASAEHWVSAGVEIGLPGEDLKKLVVKRGASWNPIRWNRTWNTIELRCLDSDRIDLDCSKLVWVCGAMSRMDLQGEALKCQVLEGDLAEKLIDQCFEVNDGHVSILSTGGIKDIFDRALSSGLRDPLVKRYLGRLSRFALKGVDSDLEPIFSILEKVLETNETTSEALLGVMEKAPKIDKAQAVGLVNASIENEKKMLKAFLKRFPETSIQLEKMIR